MASKYCQNKGKGHLSEQVKTTKILLIEGCALKDQINHRPPQQTGNQRSRALEGETLGWMLEKRTLGRVVLMCLGNVPDGKEMRYAVGMYHSKKADWV